MRFFGEGWAEAEDGSRAAAAEAWDGGPRAAMRVSQQGAGGTWTGRVEVDGELPVSNGGWLEMAGAQAWARAHASSRLLAMLQAYRAAEVPGQQAFPGGQS